MKRLSLLLLMLFAAAAASVGIFTSTASSASNAHVSKLLDCDEGGPLCAAPVDPIGYGGAYTGHDEPSALFYSNTAGSGGSQTYKLTIPSDPPTLPKQNGTGGTFNFQDRIAFWFGLALCDDQSGPNPGGSPLAGPQTAHDHRHHRTWRYLAFGECASRFQITAGIAEHGQVPQLQFVF